MNDDRKEERILSKSFPSKEEMGELLDELERSNVSKQTYQLFRNLASWVPHLRLSINIKNLLGEAVLHDVNDVLVDGLQPVERRSLLEIDSLGLPVRIREVAHGMLNIHERWIVKRALNQAMKKAKESHTSVLDRKPLDRILGKETDA